MSEANLNAQPIRTIVKEEEMPNVNTSNNNSTSSSPTSNIPTISKQESDHTDASDALSSFNKTILDQEAHDGLLGLAQLNHQDHVSDSDDDENESVSKVSALYSLLQEDSDDGEHVSSLPPGQSIGTNTNHASLSQLTNSIHLAKRAAASSSNGVVVNGSGESSASGVGVGVGGTVGGTVVRKRKASRRSAMEDDEIADAGAMEGDDDEYIADANEDDDEEMALASVKKRSSTRREKSPSLGGLTFTNLFETNEEEVISEEDLIHCVVCKRSNLQVNFKKNYTINTNNYKTYCDTFPQQSDQIPKPRDGESLSVCSTCYNKQWRFARGQYDPYKNRVVNKREGLKKPPKLKDSPRLAGSSEGGSDTPTLGSSTPNPTEESPAIEGKRRKVTKRRSSTSTTIAEDALNTSGIKEESGGADDVETPKKKAKRATKAKKVPLPIPPPVVPTESAPTAIGGSMTAAAVAANMASSTPISTFIPGTVVLANGGASTTAIPSPSPSKRGRKSKNPPANIGIVSSAPATSYKKEETLSPPPVISNTALLISYMKRINGALEEIYTTKIVAQRCPDTLEQLRDLVMERLTQKKGDLFTFDRACCNSVDRFNNSIRVEVDEFFFKDVKLNNNDSLCIYVNDKQ